MDESWRISIGSIVPRRRSTEEPRRRHRPEPPAVPALDPEDFRDVFGGPPRSVLLRRFSGDLTSSFDARPASSTSFYDEVFRPAGAAGRARGLPPAGGGEGRRLPEFRIPAPERRGLVRTEVGFYNDIFRTDGGKGGERRSRSRSKSARSKSSSAISMDDVSLPVRASALAENAVLSSFASKLRPITIPSRRRTSSPPSTISVEEENSHRTLGINRYPPQQQPQKFSGGRFMDSNDSKVDSSGSDQQASSELLQQRSHAGGGFSCCFLLPDTMSLETSFRRNQKEPVISFCNSDDDDDSPSSVISSAFHDPSSSKADAEAEKVMMEMERQELEEVEDGDQEIASSYVIRIGNVRERAGEEGAAGVDEAIAWAKEKFWSHQMAKDLDQIQDEEMFYSIEDKDGFRGQGNMVCIQFGED